MDLGDALNVLTDNTKRVPEELKAAMRRALEEIGLTCEGYAKKLCPVDTGRLRDSITHKVEGDSVYIGTDVEYGKYVELGTYKQRAQPFLRPAAQDNVSKYSAILRSELSK